MILLPTIQFRTDETTKTQSNAIFYNEVTIAALADMEQSKGKGIRGKDVHAALADLKGEDDE